jgi:hypothetical protein
MRSGEGGNLAFQGGDLLRQFALLVTASERVTAGLGAKLTGSLFFL